MDYGDGALISQAAKRQRELPVERENIIAERDGGGAVQRRFVPGPGVDEPIVWYEGSGTSDRRWFHADERGSVIAVSDASGNLVGSVNRYDEYGVPQGGSLTGRLGYTGQAWLPEAEVYHYRARAYNPRLGRFMQADPIGYEGGMSLYAYVRNDPVNSTDPLGLQGCKPEPNSDANVCGNPFDRGGPGGVGVINSGVVMGGPTVSSNSEAGEEQHVVVTATRRVRLAQTTIPLRPRLPWWWIIDQIINGSPAGQPPGWRAPLRNNADNPDQPRVTDLTRVPDNRANDVARAHGYRDAHDAKRGRGGSRVNIYRGADGRYWLWDGNPSSEKEPL